jgi:hypothetical protein
MRGEPSPEKENLLKERCGEAVMPTCTSHSKGNGDVLPKIENILEGPSFWNLFWAPGLGGYSRIPAAKSPLRAMLAAARAAPPPPPLKRWAIVDTRSSQADVGQHFGSFRVRVWAPGPLQMLVRRFPPDLPNQKHRWTGHPPLIQHLL